MKKLPIGIQTLNEIIKNNYIYIDKTQEAYDLIESGTKFYFLSRPRRFGKSLFLDTLKEIFEGNRELFNGLYIYDKWNWEERYPVIKISWSGDFQTLDSLKETALEILKYNQERLGITCNQKLSPSNCLRELIIRAYEKYNQQVVVLIDEYDKPILDTIEDIEQSKINREFIKSLYSILKDNDRYIKLGFLTGVSKFSRASIFSGLNMIQDISLNPKYGNICGYTQKNIENEFSEHLKGVDLVKLKEWYDGYNFLKDSLYNPFDILQFIKNHFVFNNYWFSTGTPTFLIKLIKENSYFLPQLSDLKVDERLIDSFDIENIDLEVILYQAGYLTIKSVEIDEDEDIIYHLVLPNKETKKSLNQAIIYYLYKDKSNRVKNLSKALRGANLGSLESSIRAIFASIPYNNYTKNEIAKAEGFYASVVYVYLQSLGIEIIGEDVTNHGRVDLTVFINDLIYIIEFKVGKGDALKQIRDRKYYEKYLNDNKDIYLVGINFDMEDRNISKFEWDRIIKR